MSKQPKVLWLYDTPGWAWDNRSRKLSDLLPNYEHVRVPLTRINMNDFESLCRGFELIVLMHPHLLKQVPADKIKNVVVTLPSQRSIEQQKYILYYSNNVLEGTPLDGFVQTTLKQAAKKIPIVSVSQKPMTLGNNICVGPKPCSHASIFEQILAGLKCIGDDAYVFLVEHDCLYHASHFTDAPACASKPNQVNYNTHCYRCIDDGYARRSSKHPALSQCSGLAGTLRAAITEKLYLYQNDGYREGIRKVEPGTGKGCYWAEVCYYESEIPNVDIRHKKNFTSDVSLTPQCQTIQHWGDCKKLREGLQI